MVRGFLDGFFSYFTALNLIGKYKLWKYLIISGIISLVIGLSLFTLSMSLADGIGQWMIGFYDWSFGRSFFTTVANVLAKTILIVGTFMLYKYVVMVAVSPIMSLLSENLEYKLSGYKKSSGWKLSEMISDIMRGLGLTIRNISKEIFFTILLFVLGFVPLIGFLSAPAIFALQSYYAGFGNIDFYLERRMNISESTAFVSEHRGLAIGNGAVYMLMLIVPIIGLIFAPALGTVAATYEAHKRIGDIHDFV